MTFCSVLLLEFLQQSVVQLYERLASLGIMGEQFRAPLKHHRCMAPRGLRKALNLALIIQTADVFFLTWIDISVEIDIFSMVFYKDNKISLVITMEKYQFTRILLNNLERVIWGTGFPSVLNVWYLYKYKDVDFCFLS